MIKIFWCKVNKYFANQRFEYLKKTWKLNNNSFLVASCVVTDNAKKKFVKEVIELANKWKKIFLTWCGAFSKGDVIDKKQFLEYFPDLKKYINQIILLPESVNENWKKWLQNKFFQQNTTRRFIVIQTWCDSFCTFCLTVHKRGKHTSRPLNDILEEINFFYKTWWKEIILTWVNLCAWWALSTTKPETSQINFLLKNILQKTKIERIRISSLWPEFLNDEFFEIIEDKRILPYFHFSFQSFSDKILKSMKRNYNSKLLIQHIKKIYNAKWNLTNIGWDIIVWFPWEKEEDFLETYNIIKNYNLTQIHAFPFSSHELWQKVPAGFFEWQIDIKTKKIRMHKLQELIKNNKINLIKKTIWQEMNILIEQNKNWISYWWTENYLHIWLKWKYTSNTIITKKLEEKDFLDFIN